MSLPRDQAWFHVKTHGYGWGFPVRWQGWIVLLIYIGAMVTVSVTLAQDHIGWFLACTFGLVTTLVALCYWKGEAPGWRRVQRNPGGNVEHAPVPARNSR